MPHRNSRRRISDRLRGRSPSDVLRHIVLRLYERSNAAELAFPVLPHDIADSAAMRSVNGAIKQHSSAGDVAWVIHPPGAGSGGHTTLFRMVAAAAEAGLHNTLLLYNRDETNIDYFAEVIRRAWPWLTADIRPVSASISGFDAVVASSWSTAHVVASRTAEGRRLYFIQDFEPYFYPRGARWALAEDTYRFGFRNIALGRMVQQCLDNETSVSSDLVPFGCDTGTYRSSFGASQRSGVIFYAKRGNDRRGFDLALRALRIFHERHPSEPIHVCGDDISDAPFPTVSHGNVSPERLNELYNSVVAGLALSFTNISLVAEEMLAAGAIAVINDSPLARADLPNPYASWSRATPASLADALCAAVEREDRDAYAHTVAASVRGRSWGRTQEMVVNILREEIALGRGGDALPSR